MSMVLSQRKLNYYLSKKTSEFGGHEQEPVLESMPMSEADFNRRLGQAYFR